MPSFSDVARDYLDAYASKDIGRIEAFLAPDVVLRDWKIRVVGKAAALRETQLNFDNASSLHIDILHLHATAQSVVAELRIVVNESVEIFVVDVFDFDAQGLVLALRSYIGRGDADPS
ncbi:MAG: nuclear transport factor 2 family protein [Burkholderiales bacterium]